MPTFVVSTRRLYRAAHYVSNLGPRSAALAVEVCEAYVLAAVDSLVSYRPVSTCVRRHASNVLRTSVGKQPLVFHCCDLWMIKLLRIYFLKGVRYDERNLRLAHYHVCAK
jgi:hypothetical protein